MNFCVFQIYEFGIITFGAQVKTNCPPRDFESLSETVIAVYWIPARISGDDSEIFFRMNVTNGSTFNRTEVDGFVAEINETRNEGLDVDAIESVIYITWVNLQQFPGILAEVSIKYVSFIFSKHLFTIKVYRLEIVDTKPNHMHGLKSLIT